MTIRPATADDVERIADMAQAFYASTEYPALYGEFSRTQACGLAIVLMQRGLVLLAERDGLVIGMVAMAIEPCIFNPDTTLANEVAFWIDPDHRGGTLAMRLHSVADDALRAMGVNVVRWARLTTSPDGVERLYARAGCTETERFYARTL